MHYEWKKTLAYSLKQILLKFSVSHDQTGIKLQEQNFIPMAIKESQILATEFLLYQHKICQVLPVQSEFYYRAHSQTKTNLCR